MELVLLVCAESAIVDSTTQRVSLFNVMEEFNSPSFPVIVPQLSLVSIFSRSARESETPVVQLRITLDGQKQPLFDAPISVDFRGHLRMRNLSNIQGMPISAPGLLKLELKSKKGALGAWKIRVNQIGQPPLTSQISPSRETPAKPGTKSSSKAKSRRKKSER